jgi:hypothetical protein
LRNAGIDPGNGRLRAGEHVRVRGEMDPERSRSGLDILAVGLRVPQYAADVPAAAPPRTTRHGEIAVSRASTS